MGPETEVVVSERFSVSGREPRAGRLVVGDAVNPLKVTRDVYLKAVPSVGTLISPFSWLQE